MASSNKATTAGNRFLDNIISVTYNEPTQEKILQFYNSNGEVYEKYIAETEFDGPYQTAQSARDLHPTQRENIRVLDVSAGTGLVCIELKKLGFKLIDALDPSEHMLAEAKKRGLYDRYICDLVGANTLDIDTDTYDVITCSLGLGAIMTGDYVAGLRELIRVIKPGGHIILTSVPEHFSEDGPQSKFETKIKPIEIEGKWKLISKRNILIHHCPTVSGAVAIFRKL